MRANVFEVEADSEDMINILAGMLADTVEAKLREVLADVLASGASVEQLVEFVNQFIAEAEHGWSPQLNS